MDWLRFELLIMDIVEEYHRKKKITTAEEFAEFSDELHQHLELAVEDYCMDNKIDDYVPVY